MNETQASQLPVYAGNDLGAVWRSSATAFRLWAPTACSAALHRFATGTDTEPEAADLGTLAMQRSEGGTWYLELAGDLAGQYYQYELQFPDGTSTVTADPYAHAAGAGGTRSMVLNQAAAVPDGWQKDERPAIPAHARSVWEVHVADFTADPASGVPQAYRGKFMGFTVDGTTLNGDGVHPTGLNYLKRLGVTHVQLQPIFDFATVDEVSGEDYNWGYDPLNYNLPEGSYATDAFHGEVRVRECRAMVQALHSAGLGVVMDVVYNHTYYSYSWLERTVPGYWNRRWENGSLTNGSGCGCDLASERTMVRKYLVDSCVYWAKEYHIDGFRFDLMALHDVETMNAIRAALDAGTLDESSIDPACLTDENGLLSWLWNLLFGRSDKDDSDSGNSTPAPVYSGWRTVGGKTYYYDQYTNQPVKGIQSIDNKLYYFDANGVQQNATFGIDVSKYQSSIDWEQVKTAGVKFVIIRIGYRGYGSGALVLDPMFEQHFTNARNAGLKVGVYFFSQAVNEEEAREEAMGCAYVLNGRKLDYPIYFDTEASGGKNGRADGLGVEDRTKCAIAFCEEVKAQGYKPGVYASTLWFRQRVDLSRLTGYSIWNAHYGVASSPISCDMWQGSCTARIPGYGGQIDVNISYVG